MAFSCEIFCSVVDNLGDAGVCWRLARQLAGEHGWKVRLWIDDLHPLSKLHPGIVPGLERQQADGVEVRRWSKTFAGATPAQVVIEAFACDLPPRFIEAMAARPKPPLWINLEYLSAEHWVRGCHGLPSPQPPVRKYFFFPGFVPGTGGLLREAALRPLPPRPPGNELRVSLFCYDNPALPPLLRTWAEGGSRLHCQVADGFARHAVESWLGEPFPVGSRCQRQALTLEAMAFLPQADYDGWLGGCDLNFVRGEDSFVRAQWAERAFVWQAYGQADSAHLVKLDAFLGLYCRDLPPAAAAAVRAFWHAWNGNGDIAATWPAFVAQLPVLERHAAPWSEALRQPGDLAGNLVRFCTERL